MRAWEDRASFKLQLGVKGPDLERDLEIAGVDKQGLVNTHFWDTVENGVGE